MGEFTSLFSHGQCGAVNAYPPPLWREDIRLCEDSVLQNSNKDVHKTH